MWLSCKPTFHGVLMAATFQNAVLTGACGGLGQALARELIGQGAAVALVGLNRPALETLAALAPEGASLCLIIR